MITRSTRLRFASFKGHHCAQLVLASASSASDDFGDAGGDRVTLRGLFVCGLRLKRLSKESLERRALILAAASPETGCECVETILITWIAVYALSLGFTQLIHQAE